MEIKTTVLEVGELVPAFAEEMLLVLFGPEATNELKPICVMHEFETIPSNFLKEGTQFEMGDNTYTITQVGSAANKNFDELGHISIYFKKPEEKLLPGAIIAEPEVFPEFQIGDVIRFYN